MCGFVSMFISSKDGSRGFLQNVGTGTSTPNYTVHIPEDFNLNIHCYGNHISQYLV
jgi:hypothetical protein